MSTKENLYIKRVQLNNFRSHKELDIELKDLNILVGENGGGKTSVLEAICYGLFSTVSSGAKKNELIRYGQKNGSVTLTLSNEYKIIKDFKDGAKLLDNNNRLVTDKLSEIEYFLGVEKDVFMNILYASQNDIYSYFIKFNAKEKDFLDSVFNLDSLTDKISLFLKNSIMELNMKYKEIQSNYTIKKNLEDSISNILKSYGMNSVNELERALDVAKYNFTELSKKNNLIKQRENIIKDLELNKKLLLNINNRIEDLEHNNNDKIYLDKLKEDFLNYISKIEKELNTHIDINDIQSLYKMFDNNTNITTHLNYIKGYSQNGINEIDNKDRVKEYFNSISKEVDTIGMLDNYRKYYQQIKNTIQQFTYNINMQVSSSNDKLNSLNKEKNQLDNIVREINRLEDQLKIMEMPDIQDIDQFNNIVTKNQIQYTQLKTTLDNVRTYQRQLDSIASIGTLEDLETIKNQIDSIEKIMFVFNRDGFVSYLRSSLLKEIATDIGDSLEKFGFTKLIPVSIDDKSGSLLFHNRQFRSLSGGEKTIAAILLRILYGKLLSHSMKLNVFLLDEPSADLDSIRVGYLRELLTKISKSLNIQIIVVTHDSEMIPEKANKILIGE